MGKKQILRGWLADFGIVAIAAPIGYFLAGAVINDVLAVVLSFAAGTLIVFIAGELIARAYRESTGHSEDLSISAGFLIGVILLFVL
jgi:zinc transporter ZupT